MDELDSIPEQDEFRFDEIEKMKDELELTINKRRKLYKRYKKASGVIDWIETVCFIGGATIAIVGAASVIGEVVAGPIAVIGFMIGLTGKIVVPRLRKKAEKHHTILLQSETSINSINGLFSRAINNGHISASEFDLIMSLKNLK